jgi:hypothetical protein
MIALGLAFIAGGVTVAVGVVWYALDAMHPHNFPDPFDR